MGLVYLLIKALPGQLSGNGLQRGDLISIKEFSDRCVDHYGSADALPYGYRISTDSAEVFKLQISAEEGTYRRWYVDVDALPAGTMNQISAGETVHIPWDDLINYIEAR